MAQPEQPRTTVDVIRATVEAFGISDKAVLIGGAAIHWDFFHRGGDPSSIDLNDVDVLCPAPTIWEVQKELESSEMVQNMTVSGMDGKRVEVYPSQSAQMLGAIKLDMLSDTDSYDNPFMTTKNGFRIALFARDGLGQLERYISEYEGVRYTELPVVLSWKTATGRPNDMSTVQKTMKQLNDQGLLKIGELSELLNAIAAGDTGVVFGLGLWMTDEQKIAAGIPLSLSSQ